MITFIALVLAFYLGTIGLTFVLWIGHILAWNHFCFRPGMTDAEAVSKLKATRFDRLARRALFGLLLPLIWLVTAQQHANELIRWWHMVNILHHQK